MFHLKVKPYVERILLFVDGGLVSEMTHIPDAQNDNERVFNGETDCDATAVLLCGDLGIGEMRFADVFSVPLDSSTPTADSDTMRNVVLISHFLPTSQPDSEPAKACILDISDRLQIALGLPPTIILQLGEINMSSEEMLKRGLEPGAAGYFARQVEHLIPAPDIIDELREEKIKISLFAAVVMKQIGV